MGKKKYEFLVSLDVKELTEVPYGDGVFFAKLRLLEGGGGSFVAFSNKQRIHKNKVEWNWTSVFSAKLSSDDETGILASKFCRISIRREIRKWKISSQKMGYFDINLAEHARGGLVSLKRILEAYDSKNMDNSMLHVTVEMRLMKGDPCYKVPNLSRIEDPYEDFETSGSNFYNDIGSIRFQGVCESSNAVVADASLHNNNSDARVEYANYASSGVNDDDDDGYVDSDVDNDEEDASAFVTANDVSVEQLESSRKMSFSSPNVARADLDQFISPILSSPQPSRANGHSSASQHQHFSSTPPVRPRRNRHEDKAAFRKKMSVDSSGVPQAGRGGGAAALTSTSSMRQKLLRCQKFVDAESGGGGSSSGATDAASGPSITTSTSLMPPPAELPPKTPTHQQRLPPSHHLQLQLQQQYPVTGSSFGSASATPSIDHGSFKRTHRRDMSAGTKTTMLWLKASEEYAEERRRRADLPPCVSADDVVDDIFHEFDQVKKTGGWDRGEPAENSGLKLSDVQ